MARYAERDCSDCGVLVAANELIPWREKQLSGTTSRSGFRTGVRGGVGFSSGGSQRFRHVNLRLCADCANFRIEAARRARFLATVRGLVIVGVIVAAVFALISLKPSSPAVDNASDFAGNVATIADSTPATPAAAASDESAMKADVGVQPLSTPQDQQDPDERTVRPSETPSADQEPMRASVPPDGVSAAMAAATPDALETGQSQRWSIDGKMGYVVPSAARAYTDRSCRNVYTTIVEHGTQVQSEPRQWCQPNGGGEWTPSP